MSMFVSLGQVLVVLSCSLTSLKNSLILFLITNSNTNSFIWQVSDFEYTKECIIFDLLNISLYHGWLLDPQEEDVATAIHSLTYNQLVERIIDNKNSTDQELVSNTLSDSYFNFILLNLKLFRSILNASVFPIYLRLPSH